MSWYRSDGSKITDFELSSEEDVVELQKIQNIFALWGYKVDPSSKKLKEIADTLIYIRRNQIKLTKMEVKRVRSSRSCNRPCSIGVPLELNRLIFQWQGKVKLSHNRLKAPLIGGMKTLTKTMFLTSAVQLMFIQLTR